MTDRQVILAIRRCHLKANISQFEGKRGIKVLWLQATVDPGGTFFGPGPYLKVPISGGDWDGTRQRVYAPARLRRRLERAWTPYQKVSAR